MERDELGLTFDGFIKEFEGIRVDNFSISKNPIKIYLLTHAHADHLKGLDSQGFSGRPVYCSEITKELLKLNPKYSRSWPSLKPLKENCRHLISTGDGITINLTLIPARHCPGAVMFLVESSTKSILITGDIRAERDWVESLPRNEFLFPYTTSLKKLDNIYLDTTFGYRAEPFIDMKPNYFGLQALAEVLKYYPMDDTFSFHFADSTIGYEEAWVRIIGLFGGQMHSSKELYKRLEMLSNSNDYEYKDRIGEIKSLNPKSKFHCCGIRPEQCHGSKSKFPVRLKHSIDISYQDMLNITHPLSWDDFKDSATFEEELPQGHKIYSIENIPHLLPKGKNYLLRNEIRFFFSRHSSYEECRHFLSLFNVDDVYPLTESPKTWAKGFQMERQFGDLLNKTENFIYDQHSLRVYGPAPTGLSTPMRIDKFSESFLRSLTDESRAVAQPSEQYEFRGIKTVSNAAFKQSFTEEEMEYFNDRLNLIREGERLAGKKQYRVEKGIRTAGPAYLHRYRDRAPGNEQQQQETFDESEDDDENLEAAVLRDNKARSRLATFEEGKSDVKLFDEQRFLLKNESVCNSQNLQAMEANHQITVASCDSIQYINIDTQQKSLIIPKRPHNQHIPNTSEGSLRLGDAQMLQPDLNPSRSGSPQLKESTASFWRRRISASPLTPKRKRQHATINLDNVSKISQAIINADGQGFFDYKLLSCQKK